MNPNGFQTNVWGPPAWFFLHCVALNYHPARRAAYERFFRSLAGVLPCGTCRDNYRGTVAGHHVPKLKLTKATFRSRDSLSYWLFRLHNYVTECRTRKPPAYRNTRKDFDKMRARYERFRATCSSTGSGTKAKAHTKGPGCSQPAKGGRRYRSIVTIKPREK